MEVIQQTPQPEKIIISNVPGETPSLREACEKLLNEARERVQNYEKKTGDKVLGPSSSFGVVMCSKRPYPPIEEITRHAQEEYPQLVVTKIFSGETIEIKIDNDGDTLEVVSYYYVKEPKSPLTESDHAATSKM